MPQPTGVRTLNRSFALPGPLKAHRRLDTEKDATPSVHTAELSDLRHPSRSAALIDNAHSKERRRSGLSGRATSPGSKAKTEPAAKSGNLSIDMESPPLVFHGTPRHSSGALLSGQLRVHVTEPKITLQTFAMVLHARLITRRPVTKDCADCMTRTTELFKWNFLTEPKKCPQGTHSFPFSYLLPGHLPATSNSEVGIVEYVLCAKAVTNASETLTIERPLKVGRALMPGPDKNSVRIFPPTNLTATVGLPTVIHPIGAFPVQLRLSGIAENMNVNGTQVQRRWRVRKMNWRIEEHSRIVSAACNKHAHRIGGEGKGILHEDVRLLGNEDLKAGWKTDFDVAGGNIEMEFTASMRPNAAPVCDVESATGLSCTHSLVLELIVAEEQTAYTKQGRRVATPTGAARVLRMQFKLIVTERAGLGVSWDEEMPPMYEDVPRSPPGYMRMDDYDGDVAHLPQGPAEYEELDRLPSSNAGEGSSSSASGSATIHSVSVTA